jgi:glycosyltransferase involved in cell wall biosynthesis
MKNENQHILLYTDDPGSGGVGQYNHSILCGLAKLDYKLTCVQSNASNPLINQREEIGIKHLWLEVDTAIPNNFGQTLVDPSDAKRIFPIAKPDFIIFSDCCPLSNFAAKQVAISMGIKYICVTGSAGSYLTRLLTPNIFNTLKFIYDQAVDIIAVSSENLESLHNFFGLPKGKGRVIYIGRPLEYFHSVDNSVREHLRQELSIPKDAIICFTAARIDSMKGHLYQIAAIEKLQKSLIWEKIYFIWAGPIIGNIGNQVKEQLNYLGVSNKVKILGQRWDIINLLDTSDIFILPSDSEGMPLSVMEAMAKGLPVIASFVGGIPEELGETGKLLTDPKIDSQATIKELVITIEEWVKNPQLRQSIGQACLERSQKMFSEERMIQETVYLIERGLLPDQTNKPKNLQLVSVIVPIIVIDGVFFQLYQTGIARVWKSLLKEWAKSEFAQHIIVLDRGDTAPKISGIRYRPVQQYDYNNIDADREMLQEVCDQEGADLFISSYYTTPTTTPSVFIAYDMIPEVMGWNINQPMWQEKHQAIKQSSAYIAISENTANDLVKYFSDIPKESITIAYCGVSSTFSPATKEDINAFKIKYGITKPYFLLVATGGYKNSILFFRAFSQLTSSCGFDIVITGSNGVLAPELRSFTIGTAVNMLQLSDEELVIAFSGAVALVYPSKYEGFGMPVIEAMACGCPVITCANASIPEVAGKAAIYVNDDDVEELENALCEVQKPGVRHALISAGLAQAKKFSWTKMAKIVSEALINATLLSLNLKEINLLIFPDWTQSEDELGFELQEIIQSLATHPKNEKITLIIHTSNITIEDAEMFLSSIAMNLLMEDLDISDTIDISLVDNLGNVQWQSLLPRIYGRVILNNEDKVALAQASVSKINSYQIDTLISQF